MTKVTKAITILAAAAFALSLGACASTKKCESVSTTTSSTYAK